MDTGRDRMEGLMDYLYFVMDIELNHIQTVKGLLIQGAFVEKYDFNIMRVKREGKLKRYYRIIDGCMTEWFFYKKELFLVLKINTMPMSIDLLNYENYECVWDKSKVNIQYKPKPEK